MLVWMFTKLGQKHVWIYGYKTYGSKNSPEVIWGHRVKNVNHVKNMKTALIQNLIMSSCRTIIKALKKSMVTLSCDLTLRGQRSKCVIFSKFSKCFSSYRLNSTVTWLVHIVQLDTLYKSYGSKNSSGVIRGQKVIFIKNALTPTDYMV